MLIYWCSFNWKIVTLCSVEVLKIKRTLLLIDYIYSLYKLNRKRYFIGGYTSNWRTRGKDGTRVNTRTPFTNFWTVKNLRRSAFSLHATRGNRASSLAANSTAKFVRTCGVYLVWAVQRAFWKRSEQEKQWWEGVQSESRRNSYNQKLLPDPPSIPDSGTRSYEWFILTALVNIRRSITWKWQRWDQQLDGLPS